MDVKEIKFKLVSIFNHFGDLVGGHYMTNIKIDNLWYNFNDHKVELIEKMNFINNTCVVLLYEKID